MKQSTSHNHSHRRKPHYGTEPCRFCHKPIDVRGHKAHETNCNLNPDNPDGASRNVHSNGNGNSIREIGPKVTPVSRGDWKSGYREGFLDGVGYAAGKQEPEIELQPKAA